jgi:hypothetical protein
MFGGKKDIDFSGRPPLLKKSKKACSVNLTRNEGILGRDDH